MDKHHSVAGFAGSSINKVLVIGYGSMGRRRIRLVSELITSALFICVDSNPKRQKSAKEDGHEVYGSLDEAIAVSPDIAFVCTSPGHHADIIIQLLSAGIHVFTELNLTSDRYDEMKQSASVYGSVLFLSSTLIYKRQMEIFRDVVCSQDKPVTYFYHIGQYLSDWHPWESYKDFFAGRKETNGVREIMAIQMPWIIRTFGEFKNMSVFHQKCTKLDIDFPDSVILNIEHKNGNIGSFVIDVVSRKAVTHLEIIGEDVFILWNGHNDDLYSLNLENKEFEQVLVYESEENIDGYSDIIVEEPYREEIKEFLKAISGGEVRYGLDEDRYVLDIIDRIEANYSDSYLKIINF